MKKILTLILLIANIFLIAFIIIYSVKKDYIHLKVDDEIISKVVLKDHQLSTSLIVPQKENALFSYWSLNGSKYENQNLEDGDVLEAVFIESYIVTFNPDNGKELIKTSVYANELVKRIDDPKKSGYKFIGWYLNDEVFDFNHFIDSDIELIAKYEKNTVKSNSYNKKVNVTNNKQLICKTLKDKGLSNSGIAAIMTNISYESGFNQTDYNGCYGLIQWCGGRFTKLKKYCGDKYNTVECQLKFMFSELNSYSGLLNSLKSNNSASSLTNSFCLKYERPANANKTCTKRANNSQKIYNYVVNGCK